MSTLMVAGEITLDELLGQVSPVELQLKRPVTQTIYTRDELRSKIQAGNRFLELFGAVRLSH